MKGEIKMDDKGKEPKISSTAEAIKKNKRGQNGPPGRDPGSSYV